MECSTGKIRKIQQEEMKGVAMEIAPMQTSGLLCDACPWTKKMLAFRMTFKPVLKIYGS